MLANLLALREEVIPAGTYVMTGGITEAVAAQPGDHFAARFKRSVLVDTIHLEDLRVVSHAIANLQILKDASRSSRSR